MILKDRFFTQWAPDICRKLLKQVYVSNQSLDSLLQLTQTVYYCREYEERKERQRKTKEQTEALIMVVKTILRQTEKRAQWEPGGKGWICYYCGKERQLKWDCPQASKPPLGACPVFKKTIQERLPPETDPRGQTLRTTKTKGTHTSSRPKYT